MRARLVPVSGRPKALTPQWCTLHWRPYQVHGVTRDARSWANLASFRAVTGLERFRLAVQAKAALRPTAPPQQLADEVLYAMVMSSRKPLCCILGDATMAGILEEALDPAKRRVTPRPTGPQIELADG